MIMSEKERVRAFEILCAAEEQQEECQVVRDGAAKKYLEAVEKYGEKTVPKEVLQTLVEARASLASTKILVGRYKRTVRAFPPSYRH
jgi:hypothetical protein